MQLSKRMPARTKTLVVSQVQKDFVTMDQQFRAIRSGSRNPMDKCHWCGHKFEDGEKMAIALTPKTGNKVLCHDCADELIASGE